MRLHRRLSSYDALSLALAEQQQDTILLTSDGDLRRASEAMAIEVHGVLWVIDRIAEAQLLSSLDLFNALTRLKADPLVFLPADEVELRLRHFALP
jgi:predicted nucleic acid-binding protein